MNNFFSKIEHYLSKPKFNLLATLYINFRSLSFKQACNLPIYIYGSIHFASLKGKILLEENFCRGSIKIGLCHCRSKGKTRIFNQGILCFKGKADIFKGSEIYVSKSGYLEFGNNLGLFEDTMIFCFDKIIIGEHTRITYHTQIFDTDFHYMIDIDSGCIKPKTAPIFIGNYNWIGNKTTIKKGVKTPDYFTVAAANSLLVKDYTKSCPINSIVGGSPAKLIVSGKRRVYNMHNERMLDEYFKQGHKDYILSDDPDIFCQY